MLNPSVMKTFLLIAVLLATTTLASAQTEENKEKLSRKERKELRKLEKEAIQKKVMNLIESKQYVLKADYLKNPYGGFLSVDDSKNFIWVDSILSVFQFSSFRTVAAGGNLGLTVEGRIFDYEQYSKEMSKSNFIRFKLNGQAGKYWVVMEVKPNGNTNAQVYAPDGRRMDYQGKLVSINEVGMLKGKGY